MEYMTVIRILANSKDDAERDVIKKKLEDCLLVSDDKLTKLVADHHGELQIVMQTFTRIFSNLRVSLEILAKAKQRLVSARELLISKLELLRKLSDESKVNQRILVLLDQEEQMEPQAEGRDSSPDEDEELEEAEVEAYIEQPNNSKLFSFARTSYSICFQEYYKERSGT